MNIVNLKLKKFNKDSTIIFSNKILALLNEELIKAIGASATSELNYEQGKNIGISLVNNARSNNIKAIQGYFKKLNTIGYLSGVLSKNSEIIFQKNKIILRGKNELHLNLKNKSNPTCSYIIGEAIGFIETLTGEKWKGKETKCVSLGYDYDEVILEKA
jgi:predicted hydrocarbon binding protein